MAGRASRDEHSCDLRDKPSHGTSTSTASAILIAHIHNLHIFATSTLHLRFPQTLHHLFVFAFIITCLFTCFSVMLRIMKLPNVDLSSALSGLCKGGPPCSWSVSGQLPAWPGVFPCTEFPPGQLACRSGGDIRYESRYPTPDKPPPPPRHHPHCLAVFLYTAHADPILKTNDTPY